MEEKKTMSKYTATPTFTHLGWISIPIIALICYVRLQYLPDTKFASLGLLIYGVGSAFFFSFVFSLIGMFRRERLIIIRLILLALPLISYGLAWAPHLIAGL